VALDKKKEKKEKKKKELKRGDSVVGAGGCSSEV
jgi:preprotein translocase subunit YajC